MKKQGNKTLIARTGKDILSLIRPKENHSQKEQVLVYAGPVETIIYNFWESLLGHDDFGINDDFFKVGGNSLKAIQLLSRISSHFSVQISLTDIFLQPTVAQIALLVSGKQNDKSLLSSLIGIRERPDRIPLSFSQERLWFIDHLEGTVQYHVPAVLRLTGNLNREALSFALQTVVERHESLRSVIFEEQGESYQQVIGADKWQLLVKEGTAYKNDQESLQQYIRQSIAQPFDLSKDYMLRATLLRLEEQEHVLIVTMHHIASDGWSVPLIVKEVTELYLSYLGGRTLALEPLKLQYADFALWQRDHLQGAILENKIAYWKEKLQGVPALQLPTDLARPIVQSTRGGITAFSIDPELTHQVQSLGHLQGSTLFMTLLAAFKVLLHRYSGQQDICVGTPIAGRQQEELEDLIGFFVNTLALRTEVNEESSFTGLLAKVKGTTIEAYEHQEAPFEKVVEAVVKERDLSRSPLFQVMFVLQNTPDSPELRLPELTVTTEDLLNDTSKYDISFFVTETDSRLEGSVEYCTDLFSEQTIARMIDHYKNLLASIVKTPEQKIGLLPMLGKWEEQQLLEAFNDTKVDYPKSKTAVDLFDEQAARYPANIALVFEGQQLTYRQLDERSNQLGHYLQSKGVKEEMLVPIFLERGVNMVIGILAILKAGGAYVPIDPAYPQERISYMLEDTAAEIVVSSKELRSGIKTLEPVNIIEIDGDWPAIDQQPISKVSSLIEAHNLAYIIYTSGSTGRPKGVMLEHGNLYSFICWCQQEFLSSRFNIVYATTSICFDLSIFEIFYPLSIGKPIRIIENGTHIGKYLANDSDVLINTVPSVVHYLLQEGTRLDNISVMNLAGEPIPLYVQQRLDTKNTEVRNLYGPTEDTTYSTVFRLTKGKPALIGKPISNTSIQILSKSGSLVPIGVPGEIYLKGVGLARGYLNNTALTLEKFIADVFDNSGKRTYKTGDVGRWLPDGNIEYISRIDDQVKVRGFRIEPGEIENVLQQYESVKQVAVLATDDYQSNKQLVGYIVPNGSFNVEGIINYLRDRLPAYMVPAVWVEMEKLPLTPNGKIDRKALPAPNITTLKENKNDAPVNKTEKMLVEIWQDLLKVKRIGIHDNFFELGGHSLLGMRLISVIRRKLNIEVAIKELFIHSTIAALAAHLNASGKRSMLPEVLALPRPEQIPLSFSQERLWFIDRLEGTVQYHVPAVLKLTGKLNREGLSYALKTVVERHESLRSVFFEHQGEPYQRVMDAKEWELFIMAGETYKNNQQDLQRYVNQLIAAPFDLSKDYMLRAVLISLEGEEHVLVVTLHHIAADGWSVPLIVKEVIELYKSYLECRLSQLAPLGLQYADFAIWQRNFLTGAELEGKIEYWKEKLLDVPSLQLPADFARPVVQSTRGGVSAFIIDRDLAGQVQSLGRRSGATLFMTLLAAFKVLLYRYSGQQDLCVGTPIAGRQQEELEGLVGFFVNTLALRTPVNEESTFTDLLAEVKNTTIEAYQHQEAPFEKVVEAVVKERDMSRSPLFQVMFALQNTPDSPEINLPDLDVSTENLANNTSKFDIGFFITEKDSRIEVSVEFCIDLYKEQSIMRMIDHYNNLLGSIVKTPDQKIVFLPMLSKWEEEQLLVAFNDTAIAYPKHKSISDLFEEQVLKTPYGLAVVFEETKITYKELNERANRLAHHLISMGVKDGTPVPICIERGIEMVVGVVALLKAGAAYVPIDPDYPLERIVYMIRDIKAGLILTSKANREKIPLYENVAVIEIDSDWNEIEKEPVNNPASQYNPDQLAYLIYTSGSTGIPKGVKMPGGALVNLLSWQEKQFVNKKRRVLQFASLNFDVSFQEIFSTLCYGSTLYLINAERRKDAAELLKNIISYKITHLFVPYIVLKNLADQMMQLPYTSLWLEEVIVAGEQLKLTDDIVSLLKKNIGSIINQYGPTEAHVVSSYTIEGHRNLPVLPPIGRPIDNTQLYILGKFDQLVPVGVSGELHIGGEQVAKGYLNQPEQTAEKFIKDFFSKSEGARLYKTGDMARWLPDGNIEYLGRIDDQVKIRGFRIEPGEIESVLQQCELVEQAVVLAKEDVNGNKKLVGYIIPQASLDRAGVIDFLRGKLPEYMIPALWVEMDKFPVTPNGKINRKALPEPDISGLTVNNYVAPRNEIENVLREIWQGLLRIERVGIYDNFFELGGHSLLAVRVISAIRRQLNIEVAIKELFIHPTIEALATLLQSHDNDLLLPSIEAAITRPEYIPLSFSQERLWFIDRLEGSVQYHLPSVLRLKGTLDKDALAGALQNIVNRHEILRTVILEKQGKGYQSVKEKDGWTLHSIDGSVYKKNSEALQQYIHKLVKEPFDLSADYMLRADLINIDEHDNILVATMHHIASDGWSTSIIVKELVELYSAFAEGRAVRLSPLPIQYADYAIWQRNHLQGDVLESKLEYWKERLNGVTTLQLPTDFPRPPVQSTRGAITKFAVDKALAAQLKMLSQQQGTTLFMTLLAAFKVMLQRYSGQQDICVGTPVAGRNQKEVETLIGFFINTLALRSDLGNDPSFTDLLQQVKNTTLEAYANQDVPFEKVAEAVGNERDVSRNRLFQVMLTFHNNPEIPELRLGEVNLSVEAYEVDTSQLDIICNITETAYGLEGAVQYCTDLFSEKSINQMMAHFKQLLSAVIESPHQTISSLSMLSPEEEHQLLITFNSNKAVHANNKTIIDLFQDKVEKTPEAIAIVFEENQISFRELDAKANQFAYYLKKKGVTTETLVPICLERSMEMIIGILGILKAGGAYVPVDPQYPEERIEYIFQDTGARIIVTTNESISKLPFYGNYHIISLDGDWEEIDNQPKSRVETETTSQDLAYIIYTSGSTGKPKGVMVDHESILSYLSNAKTRYTTQTTGTAGSFIHMSFTFDASLTAMFMPLLDGKLVVIGAKATVDVFEDPNLQKYAPYDFLKITPSHLPLLLPKMKTTNGSLLTQKLVIGGEALFMNQFRYLLEEGLDVEIINEYGPTEASVGCSVFNFNTAENNLNPENNISIGKPIDNVTMLILGSGNELVPIGAVGEICIGGPGLARGYLNLPDLTAEKFIKDPFSKQEGGRIYKTGDLGSWLPDGNIQYRGRLDEQVKIRGYRVELEEIESVLQQCKLVRQSVVLAKENKEGNKRLVAYIVPENNFDKEGILEYTKNILPEYMVPMQWIELEALPLTSNGKVNRRALPDPDSLELIKIPYAAPRNDCESALVSIWQELLDVEEVGIHDNFFELGGDSIISIQLVSRARRAGYELKIEDLFTYQTISRLSHMVDQRSDTLPSAGEQFLLEGTSGLLPIQQWYLDKNPAQVSYYNQSVLLTIDKTITEPILKNAFELITAYHDALSFKYFKKENQWLQAYQHHSRSTNLITEDLQSARQDELPGLIREHSDRYQRSLDIEKGDLLRVVLMQTPPSENANRLLIIIHHLAVDGVSWRILLEDLDQLITSLLMGEKAELGTKSTSYRQWYNELEKYGQSKKALSQKDYWLEVTKHYQPLPVDKQCEEPVQIKNTGNYVMHLGAAQTRQLTHDVPRVYHTEINDILLAALAKTLTEFGNTDKIIIGMEGHGRAHIEEDIDTSRTVGWFTTLYPLLLTVNRDKGDDDLLKNIKEQIRQVPDKGLGFGVLKYVNKDEAFNEKTKLHLLFNYLGQTDNVLMAGQFLGPADEYSGNNSSPEFTVDENLSINGMVQGGELVLDWTYSELHYNRETVIALVEKFRHNLESLITLCLDQQALSGSVFTPSDYGLGREVSYNELDLFLNEPFNGKTRKESLESLYKLSGLQQGMLFHSLYDESGLSYVNQFWCDFINPDLEVFRKSWLHILESHTALRSAFYYDSFRIPVQAVYKEMEMPIEVMDYCGMSNAGQLEAIKQFEEADRAMGFDLKAGPMMRVSLLRLNEDRYRMLWSSHHILFDGWSRSIMMGEFLKIYEALLSGTPAPPAEDDRYEDYINYIEQIDKEKEQVYWKNYLQSVEQSTLLPFIDNISERNKGLGDYRSIFLNINNEITEQLELYAQRNRITVNTLMQGVWSLLLHNYTDSTDVVYGVIVSGRPHDLPHVEQRIGMFINAIPLYAAFAPEQKIDEWLQGIQNDQVASRNYQYTPLRDIQAWTGVQGDLFDSLIVFENYPVSKVLASGKWVLEIDNVHTNEQTNYPLSLIINNTGEIIIDFSYNTTLLRKEYVEEIRLHFEHVLLQLLENNNGNLNDIKLLTTGEQQQLLQDFNNTAFSYPSNKTIIDLFEEQAASFPQSVAIVIDDEQLTYGELNARSNQLAHYLQKKGVKKDALVAICIERSAQMIVGMLGILKAGAAYVPIDPEYPAERILYMINDSAATIIISSKNSVDKLPADAGQTVILLDSDWNIIVREPLENLLLDIQSDQLAYVIYTSGSTGKPKGVMVQHSNVYEFISWCKQEFAASRFEIVYAGTSICFDLSIFEIFYPLSIGKPVRILENGLQISSYLPGDKLVMTNSVPGVIQSLLTGGTDLTNLSVVNMAGEPITDQILQSLDTDGIEVRNLYGPTEDTTYSTMTRVKNTVPVTIGKPISNTKIYIINKQQQLVPVGVKGEICISGAGLSKGYLNRTELTSEKFIMNPFSEEPGSRMYRTGDWGRWLPDGNIEYLGRMDEQVKIRGYRVELGEIENVLQQSELVNKAVVLAKKDKSGNARLVAYVVPREFFHRDTLVSYLKARIPEYMVPGLWIEMESMPLTPSGKTDRKALPDPDATELLRNQFVAPRNELEAKLADLWKEILSVEQVGIHDNFFELGGHSLLVMRLISSVKREFHTELAVRTFFELNTIEELASYIKVTQSNYQPGVEDYEIIKL